MPASWQLRLPTHGDVVEDDLLDVHVVDAYNRFARKADVLLMDHDGSKLATYQHGTPIELYYDDGSGWTRRWGGFVVRTQTGSDETQLECYGHDLWLRKRNVIKDYENTTIREILKDLVTRLTPLTWNDNLVEVAENQALSIAYKGQQLDEVINELASYSTDEVFGATNNREFFFLPASVTEAPQDFYPGDYSDVKFDENKTREINQVTVYYDDGNRAITVDDRDRQNALQANLGSTENVVMDVTRSFPEIKTEENARRKAQAILDGRFVTRTGTITTWDGHALAPGQETYVQVPEQGVDQEMRIGTVEYWWLDDETTVGVASGSGQDLIDALVDMADTVERVESQSANQNAVLTRYVGLDLPFDVDFELSAKKRTVPATQFYFGDWKGDLGDTAVGGGYLGNQAGDWQSVDVRLGTYRTAESYTGTAQTDATAMEAIHTFNAWGTYTAKQGVDAQTWLQGTSTLQLYPTAANYDHFWHTNNGDYTDKGTDATDIDMAVYYTLDSVADGIFGQGAVSGASGGYLASPNGVEAWHTDITYWVWFRGLPSTNVAILYNNTSSYSNRTEIILETNGDLQVYAAGDSDIVSVGGLATPANETDWHLAALRWDGASQTGSVFLDSSSNAVHTSASSTQLKTFQNWYLGADPSDNEIYSGDIAAAGVAYRALSDAEIDAIAANGPQKYVSQTYTHGSAIQPGITLDATMPSETSVTVAVIGSTGTASEERFEHTFATAGSFTPAWTTTHTDFNVEVVPETNNTAVTPTVNGVTLNA